MDVGSLRKQADAILDEIETNFKCLICQSVIVCSSSFFLSPRTPHSFPSSPPNPQINPIWCSPCGHVFCKDCLVGYFTSQGKLECPTCHSGHFDAVKNVLEIADFGEAFAALQDAQEEAFKEAERGTADSDLEKSRKRAEMERVEKLQKEKALAQEERAQTREKKDENEKGKEEFFRGMFDLSRELRSVFESYQDLMEPQLTEFL